MSTRDESISAGSGAGDRVDYSVVVPVFDEEGNVEALASRVMATMEPLARSFELLFVDDGSSDRTPEILRKLASGDGRIRVVRFTRNYGQEAAVEALYLHARGRWLIQMDGDLQNPPEEIPKLIARKDEGYDVVYAVRQKRQDALFRVAASRAMQWTMRSMMEIELPDDVSTFRLMSAPIARLVAALPEKRRKFFSALLVWSGARIGNGERGPRAAAHADRRTTASMVKLLNHTFDLIVGFSSKPLRYIGTLGFIFAVVGFGMGLWVISRKLLWDYGMMGWPSLFAAVVILGGMQLMATSVIGEYIARIYVQAQSRPLYNVAERLNFDAAQGPDERPKRRVASKRRARARVRARVRARARARARARVRACARARARVRARASARARDRDRACDRKGGGVLSRVVVVGCGFPQLSLVRAAKRRRLFVIGADANPRAIAVRHCDEFAEISTSDVDGLCDLVRRTRAVAVTTTGSEVSLKATADVAARLKLPFYADPETVRRCQEKDAMRAAYRAAGLAVPAFARCERVGEARAFARERGFPLVVKPSRGWGQRGVARVDSGAELSRAFEEAWAHSASAGLPLVVVEEWLDGREYSVNGWVENGRLASYCVTERITVPGHRPLGVMIAEVYPSGLSPESEARVVGEARRGAGALGHERGPCYSQVALGSRGCFLFETAARLGGGFDADVTYLASGVDLYDRLLGVALADAELERQGVTGPAHGGAIAKFLVAEPGADRSARSRASTRPARSPGSPTWRSSSRWQAASGR